MKVLSGVLLLAFLGPLSLAHADVMVNGSVSTTGSQGVNCSQSGAAPTSLSLVCADTNPVSSAMVTGGGNAFTGSVAAQAYVLAPPVPQNGQASASIELELNQEYLLTGGTGTTTVDLTVNSMPFMTASATCSFSFNGVAAPICDPVSDIFSETVQYGVPFTVDLDLHLAANGFNGAPSDGSIGYDVSQPVTQVGLLATPEPSSVWLLLPGMAGVMFKLKRRRALNGIMAASR